MSAPRADWITMPNAQGIIRRETQLPPGETEPALLEALANGQIRSRHTIWHYTDVPVGYHQGQTVETSAEFWRREEFTRWYQDQQNLQVYAPNDHEGWHFELNYDELLRWLSRESRSIAERGRRPRYDWEAFWIEVAAVANTPDGLPETQADFERQMSQWFESTYGASPAESSIRDKAGPLYKRLKAGK